MTTSFSDRLSAQIRKTGSATCVGLDPRKASLPGELRLADDASPEAWAASYETFAIGVIDAVAGKVPVVKPQAAFFEQLGPAGMQALYRVVQHAHRAGLLTIMDGKRNDIGSTAEAYADAYLGAGDRSPWGSDSLTVSPYLGADSLDPFIARCDERAAGIFVLVKTSNPGGGMLQDRRSDSDQQTIYQTVAQHIAKQNATRVGASGYGPVGAVVGATYPEQLAELRKAMPQAYLLIPGFGAQGGGAQDVAAGFHPNGLGAVVNNSRGIIFAHQRPEYAEKFGASAWQDAVAAATDLMNQQLASVVQPAQT
ncbi:Orotidine 5'-phosphate decarboxylase [Roseimaritima multifibrata]|uniref:Orotidine 5'-phosphate decarboxylase n=1 Tax=Roseimaritima multifibrata TaxID=1930274 RepID=A0A517MK94_9BACT|nr:orotidine-5'-phosphate decarboxylase [Roseimaritima multifibrata]QDS95293.1 Orotidine 5'-phosphate decarboxylase [Roseimaritima multifibrata]